MQSEEEIASLYPTFNVDYLCGPSWYLSALIIATAILYPIAKNFRKVYSNIICPVVVLVVLLIANNVNSFGAVQLT